VKVTAEAARRFLVARHFLAPARSLTGLDGVLEVFRRLGSIQFDPVAVAGRNHDLVLHARVADYEADWCDELYEHREIFETTNKALSFVPMSEFPWFRSSSGRKGRRFHAAALAENVTVAERVLEGIRGKGPLSSRDFEREAGPTKDWFGMTATSGITTSSNGCSRPRCSDTRYRCATSSDTSSCPVPRARPARGRRRRRHVCGGPGDSRSDVAFDARPGYRTCRSRYFPVGRELSSRRAFDRASSPISRWRCDGLRSVWPHADMRSWTYFMDLVGRFVDIV
jgi:DNA glycosylase AlkZ-like